MSHKNYNFVITTNVWSKMTLNYGMIMEMYSNRTKALIWKNYTFNSHPNLSYPLSELSTRITISFGFYMALTLLIDKMDFFGQLHIEFKDFPLHIYDNMCSTITLTLL